MRTRAPATNKKPPGVRAGGFCEGFLFDGTVAMARSQDPNSAGSQFYIAQSELTFLDGNYTVFGKISKGLDIVHQLAVGDVMESVKIEKK